MPRPDRPSINSGIGDTWRSMSELWDLKGIDLSFIAYRIWYADGSIHESWAEAPDDGLQILMFYYADGRRAIVDCFDEYTLPDEPTSKYGMMIDEEAYLATRVSALADPWRPTHPSVG